MTLKDRLHQDVAHFHSFESKFIEQMLQLLWHQWRVFGVGGKVEPLPKATVLDPEAMLLAVWQFGRYEPRLFDEVLRWCCYWGDELDVARLNTMLKEKAEQSVYFVASAFATTVEKQGGLKRWSRVASNLDETKRTPQALFIEKQQLNLSSVGSLDTIFKSLGWLRGIFELRGNPIDTLSPDMGSGLRLFLRRLFGMGIKAEALCILLMNEEVSTNDIVHWSGYTSRGIQQTLGELVSTGLVQERNINQKEKRYSLHWERWMSFLHPESQVERPQGLNWFQVYRGLSEVWEQFERLSRSSLSSYQIRSCLSEATRKAHDAFMFTDLRSLPVPVCDVESANFFTDLHEFWNRVFYRLAIPESHTFHYLFLNDQTKGWPVIFSLPWGISLPELLSSDGGKWLEIRGQKKFTPPLPREQYLPFWVVPSKWVDTTEKRVKHGYLEEIRSRDTYWLQNAHLEKSDKQGAVFLYEHAPSVLIDGCLQYVRMEDYPSISMRHRWLRMLQSQALAPLRFGENRALGKDAFVLFDDTDLLWKIIQIEQGEKGNMVIQLHPI